MADKKEENTGFCNSRLTHATARKETKKQSPYIVIGMCQEEPSALFNNFTASHTLRVRLREREERESRDYHQKTKFEFWTILTNSTHCSLHTKYSYLSCLC